MAQSLEATVSPGADGVVIALRGDIDGSARDVLDAAYADAAGSTPMTLGFEDVEYINSTGIALIVGVLARARADGRPVSARGLSEHYREIFEITRLSDFITILADEPSAVAADHGGDR
jgi:anti-sigma B factor antagonist